MNSGEANFVLFPVEREFLTRFLVLQPYHMPYGFAVSCHPIRNISEFVHFLFIYNNAFIKSTTLDLTFFQRLETLLLS